MRALRILGFLGLALLLVGPAPPEPPVPLQAGVSRYFGQYYPNPFLEGGPVSSRDDDCIKFNWGFGGPVPGVGGDDFSVRWTKDQVFQPGYYRFHLLTDDGARFWIDPQVNNYTIINAWQDQAPTEYTAEIQLQGGQNRLQVEYYEHAGGAVIEFWWEVLGHFPDWKGEYFKFYRGDGPCDGPVLTRNDSRVYFDWGSGSPSSLLDNDFWAARWTGSPVFAGGYYRFYTRTDDGVRLWVDTNNDGDFNDPGEFLIDRWIDQSATVWWADAYLSPGTHRIKMEYYELVGDAVAQLWWRSW